MGRMPHALPHMDELTQCIVCLVPISLRDRVATLAERQLRPWSRPRKGGSLHLENKMMQRTIRYSVIGAITWLLSVVILISAAQFDVAQAKKGRAAGCGKELQKQCGGVPVQANNMLECLQKNQEKLSPRCVEQANNVVRSCDRDAVQHCQAVAAGQGNILGCLRTAKRVVSPQCHAALDAVFPRR
jgi:Cysteine rich repeat